MKKRFWNIFFAPDNGAGAGGAAAAPDPVTPPATDPAPVAPEPATPPATDPAPATITAEEAARQVEAAKAEAKAAYEQQLAEKLTEAEKLAKMSKEDREKYELQQRLAELEKKEQAMAARELKNEAIKTLSEKGLPMAVADFLVAENAEATAKRIDTFKGVFDQAVQAAVEERLKGKTPVTGGGSGTQSPTDQMRSAFSSALRGGF